MTLDLKPQYLVDATGNRTAVQLSLEDFQAILDTLENAEDVLLYDQAKREDDGTYISLEDMKTRLGLA